MNTQVDGCALTHLDNLLLDLLLHLGYNLLDACRVDTAVGYKLVQSQTRNLTTHGVKSAQDDCLGGVIHDNLDACCSLQSADIAALTTNDASLYLVALDVEYRNGILDSCLGCYALYRCYDDALRLLCCCEFRLLDCLVDIGVGFRLGFSLHILHKDILRILCAHTRNLLQADILLLDNCRQLLLLGVEALHLSRHLLLQTVILLDFILEVALLIYHVILNLLCALLTLCNLLVALVDLTVMLTLKLNELLLGL